MVHPHTWKQIMSLNMKAFNNFPCNIHIKITLNCLNLWKIRQTTNSKIWSNTIKTAINWLITKENYQTHLIFRLLMHWFHKIYSHWNKIHIQSVIILQPAPTSTYSVSLKISLFKAFCCFSSSFWVLWSNSTTSATY